VSLPDAAEALGIEAATSNVERKIIASAAVGALAVMDAGSPLC
jgi:hypothetical protein